MKNFILSILVALISFSAIARPESMLDVYSDITGLDLRLHTPSEIQQQKLMRQFGEAKKPETQNGVFIPFELSSADMVKIAAAASVAVMFFANDEEITNFTQEHKSKVSVDMAKFGQAFGNELGIGITLTGIIVGVVMDNDKVKNVSIMAAEALLVSGLATMALKNTFHRERPRNTDDPYNFSGPGLSKEDISFPSGHTTAAFALATVIAETYGDKNIIIPILAYSAAAITGWSRVHDRAHWASDVLIGGLIGHLVAENVMNQKLAKKGFTIIPSVGFDGSFAVNVRYTGRPHEKNCAQGLTQYQAVHACIEQAVENSHTSIFRR
jgi:uncharacterized membrane protein YsdA (DUF1294 family)